MERPARGPDPLVHGAQGGANLNITNGEEVDEDAEGEDDEGYTGRERRIAEEDVDEDEDELGAKRRRVEVDDYDDDDV